MGSQWLVRNWGEPITHKLPVEETMSDSKTSTEEKGKSANTTSLRGVHHLAICVENFDEMFEFYHDVLGLELIHAMRVPEGVDNFGNPPWESVRHYFFNMGNDSSLAFFELPKGARGPADRNSVGAMQHVAFSCTPPNFEAIQERLSKYGYRWRGPAQNFPGVYSIYTYDPSNIRIEVTCQIDEGPNQRVVDALTQTKEGARKELVTLIDDEDRVEHLVANLPDA